MNEPTDGLFQDIERERRGLEHIDSAQSAKRAAEQETERIRDDLNDADAFLQEQRFADLYVTAAAVAGKSVRLAAIARQGMIQTEGGEHGERKTD